MSGITDMPFRIILQKHGCRFAFTEMIDANGLFYNNRKTFTMLKRTEDAITIGAQLVGSDIEKIINAAKICEEQGFRLLELNAGCPAKKVIKDGKGSALLKDPKKLGKVTERLVKELKIPVTVKIRSGWDDNNLNYAETAKIIANSGAAAICIHPRTRKQMYKGKPNHSIIREIKHLVKIPVFASGNAFNPETVMQIFSETGCDAVAIARGALGRPWIFKQIYDSMNCISVKTTLSLQELKNIIHEHMSHSINFHGEGRAFHIMYKHLQWYLKSHKNRIEIMRRYREIKGINKFQEFLNNLTD
jgi:tRNA-dihydrouridine synthase B